LCARRKRPTNSHRNRGADQRDDLASFHDCLPLWRGDGMPGEQRMPRPIQA
jgi:hypothetical protein